MNVQNINLSEIGVVTLKDTNVLVKLEFALMVGETGSRRTVREGF